MTAGQAVERVSNEVYFARLNAAKERMRNAWEQVEKELLKKGYRVKGTYQIEEERTGFYLKMRTS